MKLERARTVPDVLILQPEIFHDDRGRFLETHRAKELIEETGWPVNFIQGNVSYSHPFVLRGLHFQTRSPQGKLMMCISGQIQHITVDLRAGSPYFGKHVSTLLDSITCHSVWCPPGFASGFLVLGSSGATVAYQCTTYYMEEFAGAVNWKDSDLNILWMTQGRNPILSRKDRAAPLLRDIESIKV